MALQRNAFGGELEPRMRKRIRGSKEGRDHSE